jgi:hypothetical protein
VKSRLSLSFILAGGKEALPHFGNKFQVDSSGATNSSAPDPPWLWRGYLAPGQLTLLTSLWKSGKTTLLAILLARLKDGGELLGQAVRPDRALVLSEEKITLWQMRQQRLDLGENALIICRPFAGKGWRSGCSTTRTRARRGPANGRAAAARCPPAWTSPWKCTRAAPTTLTTGAACCWAGRGTR